MLVKTSVEVCVISAFRNEPEMDRSSCLAIRKKSWVELGESEDKLEPTGTNWNSWGKWNP